MSDQGKPIAARAAKKTGQLKHALSCKCSVVIQTRQRNSYLKCLPHEQGLVCASTQTIQATCTECALLNTAQE